MLPLYVMMVQALKLEILNGIYPVGTPLPSEAVLATRFAVSRQTVRQALRTMRESGLVTPRQGLGTIVNRPGDGRGYVHQVNKINDLFPVGVDTRYEPVDGSLVCLPQWARFTADLNDQRLWLRVQATRSYPGRGAPFNELEVFVAARFAGIGRAIDENSGSIHGLIETLYGEAVGEVTQVFGAFSSRDHIGGKLGMQSGEIGIEIRRVFRLASDSGIAMLSFNRYLPKDFSFSMTLRKISV